MEKEGDANTVTMSFKDHRTCDDSSKECRWDAEFAFFVLKQCVISRILLFIIQFLMNVAVTDYPTDAFRGIPISQVELSQADHWIRIACGGLTRWDAVHFLHIAQYGYTSNGIFNFGYIVFQLMVETVYSTTLRKFIWERDFGTVLLKLLRFVMVFTVCWGIFGSQVASHDSRVHLRFCSLNITHNSSKSTPDVVYKYALQNGLILPHDLENLTWCRQERSILYPLPSFYKHIQMKYWQVKPFGYWQLRKLPCFIMAAPACKQHTTIYDSCVGVDPSGSGAVQRGSGHPNLVLIITICLPSNSTIHGSSDSSYYIG
uniref:GPI mannosyltransferase 2 n=1 Tax=Setaria digitata TaxID=48799 RepID=A0A915Q1D0_9BILA